jgi:hypothetical protein
MASITMDIGNKEESFVNESKDRTIPIIADKPRLTQMFIVISDPCEIPRPFKTARTLIYPIIYIINGITNKFDHGTLRKTRINVMIASDIIMVSSNFKSMNLAIPGTLP